MNALAKTNLLPQIFETRLASELDAIAAQIESICAANGVRIRVTGGVQLHYVQLFFLVGEQVTQQAANALWRLFKCDVPVTDFPDCQMIEVRR